MGLLFTPKLSWSSAKLKLAAQAKKAIFAIRKYQQPFGKFLHNDIFKLFDAMVTPILCYASEVWGYEYSGTIEKVQVDFCKYFLGVNSSVNNSVALGECGRLPLCITYHTNCIKYWCKLLHMHNNRYPKNCYKMLKSLDEAGRLTWASNIKKLLFRYGYGFVWVSQEVGDINIFIKQFKQRLIDCMKQNWHGSIEDSPRCDTYKYFKTLLNPEKYLCIDMPFLHKKAMSRFRCSSHKFKIETGRHQNIDRENRFCQFCEITEHSKAVEDEYHVFFVCPRYSDIRLQLLLSWYSDESDLPNFYNILQVDDTLKIRKLSNYIHHLLKRNEQPINIST